MNYFLHLIMDEHNKNKDEDLYSLYMMLNYNKYFVNDI